MHIFKNKAYWLHPLTPLRQNLDMWLHATIYMLFNMDIEGSRWSVVCKMCPNRKYWKSVVTVIKQYDLGPAFSMSFHYNYSQWWSIDIHSIACGTDSHVYTLLLLTVSSCQWRVTHHTFSWVVEKMVLCCSWTWEIPEPPKSARYIIMHVFSV